MASENNDEEGGPINLPQPSKADSKPYRYHRFEQMQPLYFPDSFQPGTLCWVMLSKGKKKTPQLASRARVVEECEDDRERIVVRYPSGSTYRVRRSNLMPVMEHESHIILVASETNDYRRTAIVQTLPEDHFVEIGCDFGILVDSVDCQSRLGVDKSEESIRIAKERYPSREFLLGDIFEDLEIEIKQPLVVAIDINGNRMLPAVLKCLQLVLDRMAPRLVVVKSRELYAEMVKREINA
jgi:hypothetical protein